MEGMWTRFLPLIAEIRTRLAAGEIGEIRCFHGAFLAANRPDSTLSLFDPRRGGGALMHRGVYPLSLARHFLGPVSEVSAVATVGRTGVDEDCALILRHRSGSISSLRASLRTAGTNDVIIHGTRGVLCLEAPIYRPFAARISRVRETTSIGASGSYESLKEGAMAQALHQRVGPLVRLLRERRARRFAVHYRGNGYQYEAEEVMRAVSLGALESEVMPLDESVEVMSIIDRARASWRLGVSE